MLTLVTKLDSLSPLKTLTRGYCIAQKDGKIIKTIEDVKKDDEINLKFIDGQTKAIIQ